MPKIRYKTKRFKEETMLVIGTAEEILEEYAGQGYSLTLRQLYYQFVARGLIPNRQSEYDRLGEIVNNARLAGLIDWHHIEDRTRGTAVPAAWDSPAEIIEAAARGYARDKWEEQPVRIEVAIEKDALVGVIQGPCDALNVPYLSCRGYLSQSEAWRVAMRYRRLLAGGQRVLLLHLGDHDPSGIDMTRDLEERIGGFVHGHLGYDGSWQAGAKLGASSFAVRRIALTMEQVEEYGPPPNPAKLTDSRAGDYVATYGYESWELDALEPRVLDALIREHVEGERDEALWEEAEAEEDRERELLEACTSRWADVAAYLEEEA